MPENWQEAGFGLYVHWPFCQSKCPYCDFNSHVSRNIDQQRYMRALVSEIRRFAELVPDRVLSSIFFGGGTPSLMEPAVVDAVLKAASDVWTFGNDIEITLEANPTSVDASRFAGYADAGVNRISVGVQALNDADLLQLGRLHSATEALGAIETARSSFDRVSMDLIYARMNQGAKDWESELNQALALGLDHYALYQLTIEDGTAFGERYRNGGLRGLPNEALSVELWEITQGLCHHHGLGRYEVSNHAKRGQESRHNQIYWRSGDWVGVGPGAHGRVSVEGQRLGTVRPRMPTDWLTQVEAGAALPLDKIDAGDWRDEAVIMGLRTEEGLDLRRLRALFGDLAGLDVQQMVSNGLLREEQDRLCATESGLLLLNSVISEILPS